jgi:uncharacterized protein
MSELSLKERRLVSWFEEQQGVITAFSGGVDSALVLYFARKILGKKKTIGVISKSESLKSKDYQIAVDFARQFDVELKTIHTNELADLNYTANTGLRCYFCKTHLYDELQIVRTQFPDFTIVNGSNADDKSDYRPGEQAAVEKEIRSPLAECDITKEEIRALAKKYKLSVWNKPASPCLSSRIPYGNEVNVDKLKQIEQAENILNSFGFEEVRVRHYGAFCRIEVLFEKIPLLKKNFYEISSLINEHAGFQQCSLDEEGLVSGKLNRVLNAANE